jgi:hypothetical protein
VSFGLTGRAGLVRQHLLGAVVFVITLGLTRGALGLLDALAHEPSRALELAMLIPAGACATVTRYVALRTWVFAPARVAVPRARPVP